ncbi:hypothetical protein PG996_004783 [Apiospora saccharicola]|uniref:Uncharacterized protein n=1 Tax=Apiospora saccharicola TaxID=335842 RepID=A0ABR1W529_9PEZI
MDVANAINNAAKQIAGLDFGRRRPFSNPKVVFAALVANTVDEVTQGMTQGEITGALEARLTTLASHATQGHDVFTRVRGNSAFYVYIAYQMNPLCPLSGADIESIFSSLLSARERALSVSQGAGNAQKSKLMIALDVILGLRRTANDQARHDHALVTVKPKALGRPSMLRGPNNNSGIVVGNNSPVWPPAHFSPLNVAHLCQQDVHLALFGITPESPGAEPIFPTDQDNPIAVRRFLCYENLTKNKTVPATTWALYCAPVAFLDDGAREAWYVNTGHRSRFYSTLPEFIEYAKGVLSSNTIERVMCLLTPWFYDVNEVMALANGELALPVAWEKTCYRSGMAMLVEKDGKMEDGKTRQYKVVIFQPQAPRYPRATPRGADRGQKQHEFVGTVIRTIVGKMNHIASAWVGGTLQNAPDTNGREVSPDSVELSANFVSELTEDPSSLTIDPVSLSARHFRNADVRESAWE